MTLYFLYMEGCPACEIAKPELAKFQRSHAGRGIQVVPVDLLKAKWTYKPWSPDATPTYVLEELGYPRVQHVGGMKKDQIVEFIRVAKSTAGIP